MSRDTNFMGGTMKLEVCPGACTIRVFPEALALAKKYRCKVKFKFNDRPIVVTPDSTPADMDRQFYQTEPKP